MKKPTQEALDWAKEKDEELYKSFMEGDRFIGLKTIKKVDPSLLKDYYGVFIQEEYERHSYHERAKQKNKTWEEIGSFDVGSDSMYVSDPCYDENTWHIGLLENVEQGKWNGKVYYYNAEGWGLRIAKLIVTHAETKPVEEKEKGDFVVGVDSGLAGFCEKDYYENSRFRNRDWKSGFVGDWYRNALLERIQSKDFTVIGNKYMVCSTGFGDGSYVCYYWKNESGKICQAMIEFISDEEIQDDEKI